MLVQFVVRYLPVAVVAGLVLQAVPASGEDGQLHSASVFKNIGYTLPESTQPTPPNSAPTATSAPVVDAPTYDSRPVAVYQDPAAAQAQACAPACCCVRCDAAKKAALQTAAAGAHKGLFYLNDFSYLQDPCYDGCLLGDGLKGLGGPHLSVDMGGQYRARVHREENHRGLGLTGRSDDFLLHRTRLYLDAKLGDNIRFFGEAIDADSNYEAFPPRPIEENRWDAQNLFLDLTLIDNGNSKLVARGGRQELLLGNQRYASPLDWANARRTFDGGRLLYTNENWNIDGFWLAPMVPDRRNFDEANEDVAFYGVYSTYKALADGTLDLYWLALDNDVAGFYFDSLGGRYNGKLGNLLFEAEGAYQFGTNADGSDHDAGFFVVGAGKAWSDRSCKPTTWLYFDWASGADQQGAGNGHHHFFPLAHKWNGFMDLFGRRNLIDLNLLTTFQISKKVKLLTWYHSFWLENDNDTPYNVTMSPFAAAVTPGDDHLGQEIDAVLTFGIDARSNILFGYSHFWAGDYYETPGLPFDGDADFFYTQYTRNF